MTNPLGRAGRATRTRTPTRGERPALPRAGPVQPRGPGCRFARAPPLIFNFLRGANGTVPRAPATLRERGAGAAAAGTSLHPVPRRAAPRAGRRVGKEEQRAPGLSHGPAVPAAVGGGRAPAVRRGRASPGPSPPRQPSAGRCRSGSGKPRPPPRVWRGWAHPRHCLRGGPCLLRAPAGGAAVPAAMLKGCAPPQRRQRAPALGSSHPAC